MQGITIGAGCVIAAGSVVTKDIPEKYLRHGEAKWCRAKSGVMFQYVKNIAVNNTTFDLD